MIRCKGKVSTMNGRACRCVVAVVALAALDLSCFMTAPLGAAEPTVYGLGDCIAIAQKSNPEIAIAAENCQKAEGNLLMNYGSLLPEFSMNFTTGHRFYGPSSVQYDASGRPVQSNGFDYPDYGFGLSSDIQLYDGGGNYSRIRSAMSGRDATSEQLKHLKDVIAARVIRAYYDLVRNKMLVRVQEESAELAKKNLERSEALLQVGSATKADVLKARVRYSNTRLAMIQAKNDVELAREDLSVLLNMRDSGAIDVDTTITIEFTEYDAAAEVQSAMVYRSDLKSLEYGIKSARASVSAARSGWLPSLYASFGYNWNDRQMPENYINFFDNEYTWYVAGYLRLNIFDRFQTSSSVRMAKADARIAEHNFEKAQLEAARQVKSIIIIITQARERIVVATETVEQAAEDVRLAGERYRVGAGTMLESIDAQVALTQAKADVIEAKCDFLIASADLAVATGKRVYK